MKTSTILTPMLRMLTLLKSHSTKFCLALAVSALGLPGAYAAGVFYSFDTAMDGTGAYTANVTSSTFPDASTVSVGGSTFQGAASVGGELSFTDFLGNTWTGSGNNSVGGHSLQWNPNSSGNFFNLELDTTGLSAINIRMAVRDAIGAGGSRVGGFSSFTYDIGDGPEAITGLPVFGADNNFNEWSMDLSSISAIDNQSSVTFRWDFDDVAGASSVRIDNVQFTAIPEPATIALVLGILGGVIALRRRK